MKMNEYFGFKASPFSNRTKILYESKDYLQIKQRMNFYLEEDGVALITGLHGTGKTKIVNSLLPKKDRIIYIPNSDLTLFEFMNCVGSQLEVDTAHCHISKIVADINRRVDTFRRSGEKVILIIDGIENAPLKMIESLKFLYDCEESGMYVILVGHSSFRAKCKDTKLQFLVNNIVTNYDCVGLSLNETKDYIKLRIKAVGGDENLIEDKFYSSIYEYTKGNPQIINKFMATVFLTAYMNNTKEINNKIIKLAKDEIVI